MISNIIDIRKEKNSKYKLKKYETVIQIVRGLLSLSRN